jgi:hypothetical protein
MKDVIFTQIAKIRLEGYDVECDWKDNVILEAFPSY